MKRGLIWCVCCLSLFMAFAGNTRAENPEQIVMVFFDKGYPPFYMEGLQEGMFIDFIAAFEQQHPEFKIIREPLSRKRIDLAMDEGSAQASSITNPLFVGEQQAAKTLFTKPIWTTGNYIIMNKNNVFEYTRPEDLFGKSLGVIYGNRNAVLDPHLEAGRIIGIPANNNLQLYRILEANRVDAIIANNHVMRYEIKRAGIDPSQFVFSQAPVMEFELMTQVQKTQQAFRDALDEFIEQSKQNGLLDQITKKYLE